MDTELRDLFPEEGHVAEIPQALVPEQTEEDLTPRSEDVPEFAPDNDYPISEEAHNRIPNRESPVSHPYEHDAPYVRPEQVYGYNPYETAPNGPYGYPPKEQHGSPYEREYYRPPIYGQPYAPVQQNYYGGNYVPLIREAAYTPPMPYVPPKPVVRKNNKTVGSLILGILAMAVLNFMPFVALILGIIAVCTGYTGLKQDELTKGKRICGFIGLALGIISLILSVTMLIMLLTLSIRATKAIADSANNIIR